MKNKYWKIFIFYFSFFFLIFFILFFILFHFIYFLLYKEIIINEMKTIDAMYSRSLLWITLIFESTTLLLVCFIIKIHLCKFVQLAEIDIFLFIY